MNPKSSNRGLITLAFGGREFIEMAKWLGMSLRLNAPNLSTAIVTDSDDPELAEFFTHVIPHRPEMGHNMYPKFHLDHFSPFDETIYVDTDCLVLNDLEDLWSTFQRYPIGILGWRYLTKDDIVGDVDVAYVLEYFNLQRLPKFNGGCYYFRKGPESTQFFDLARHLLEQAPKLRIGNYRGGGFSDEPIFALALEMSKIPLVSAGTRGMWTPLGLHGSVRLDVFAGQCSFEKQGILVTPDIVHFPAGFRECLAYHRAVWKLKTHFGKQAPGFWGRSRIVIASLKGRLGRIAVTAYRRWLKGERGIRMVLNSPSETQFPTLSS